MKKIYCPLKKEHPELGLKITLDFDNNMILYSGNPTPSDLKAVVLWVDPNNSNFNISSIRYPDLYGFNITEIENKYFHICIGGTQDNKQFNMQFITGPECLHRLTSILKRFVEINLNKQITIL